MSFSFSHLLPGVGTLLVASILQGGLLSVGAAVTLRLTGSVPSAVRTTFLMIVLLLIVALPIAGLFRPATVGGAVAEVHVAQGWSFALLCVWLTLSALRLLRLAADSLRTLRLARSATRVQASAGVTALLTDSPRPASLFVTEKLHHPSVLGFFRPRVLLPRGLMESLSETELLQVVLHEMEHLRRHDDWLNLVQQLSLVLLPWNPALLWLDHRLSAEREMACDDSVLRKMAASKTYASCLVKLAERSMVRKGVMLALGFLGSRRQDSEFGTRIRRILMRGETGRTTARFSLASGLLMTVTMSLAGWSALHSPSVQFDGGRPQLQEAAVSVGSSTTPFGGRFLSEPARPGGALARTVAFQEPARALQGQHANRISRHSPAHARPVRSALPTRALQVVSRRSRTPSGWRLTKMQAPQFVYAAVPFQDGWLIVQL